MLIDANKLEENHTAKTDICIIGAGVAGITIARQLASTGLDIILLESGGLDFSADTQQLYDGDYIAKDIYKLTTSRLRYLGGSSNHWEGNCSPFKPSDFLTRDWIPRSGWPVQYDELAPYYDTAAKLCELQSTQFDAGYWVTHNTFEQAMPGSNLFSHEVVIKSPPTRFGLRYRDDLSRSSNIQLFLNANVTNIVPDNSGNTITRIDCKTLSGKKISVVAKHYVLACGGIENARLLLAANRINPVPLSSTPDNIGRYFMDHAIAQGGSLVCPKGNAKFNMFSQHTVLDGQIIRGFLRNTPALQKQQKIGDCFLVISPALYLDNYGKRYLRQAKRSIKERDIAALLNHQLTFVKTLANRIIAPLPGNDEYDVFNITVRPEQVPNPDSRITLMNEVDALGMPKARVEWQLTEMEFRTMHKTLTAFASEAGRLGIGRFRFELGDGPVYPERMNSGPHHMGSTRMSDKPADGVVDKHCKVHGVDNLYIAGSSVFPTSSSSMPTLTIVALAVRLAEHIKQQSR